MNSSTRQHVLLALLVILVAVSLRIYGIDWSLPDVYEEATPLRKAWAMWAWGQHRGLDLNPHFFNYPTLTIYLQLAAQALLYAGMRLFGTVGSAVDLQVAYLFERTPFYVAGRLVTVLFAIATVWIVYRKGRRIVGDNAGLIAAFLLAINAFHIAKSQVIEVDVPLACFVTLALFLFADLVRRPTLRAHLAAGLTTGLATSTKYPGALLVIPFVVAHLFSRRAGGSSGASSGPPRPLAAAGSQNPQGDSSRPTARWLHLLLGGAAAVAAFAVTSPFVLIDWAAFRQNIGFERQHMALGHFGSESFPAWKYYAQSLAADQLGWPLLVCGVAGLVYLAAVKRRTWAIVFAAFIVPYTAMVGMWTMHADRYLLPIMPASIFIAVAFLAGAARSMRIEKLPRARRTAAAVLVVALMALPSLASFPHQIERLKTDTRTMAREWIEENVLQWSLIALEHHGPELFSPVVFWDQSREVQQWIRQTQRGSPLFATLQIPMFSVRPELSSVFYDVRLYETADLVITSSAVRSRYEAEPARFPSQCAFYDSLDASFVKAAEFRPGDGHSDGRGDGPGPVITIYRNPRQGVPFGKRTTTVPPPNIRSSRDNPTGQEGFFYFDLGLNYETFRFYAEALACYQSGFAFKHLPPDTYMFLTRAIHRCLTTLGRSDEARAFLESAIRGAPDASTVRRLRMP